MRAFKAVGGEPVFIREARGPYLYGADGAEYVDFLWQLGPHDPRARRSLRDSSHRSHGGTGDDLWRAHRGAKSSGRDPHRSAALHGDGALGLERHGSRDGRPARGARISRGAT